MADQDPGPLQHPRERRQGGLGREAGTAQMWLDPDTIMAVPDGEGRGEVGVGSRQLKVPRGLDDLPTSSVRNNVAAHVLVLDGALCEFQAP